MVTAGMQVAFMQGSTLDHSGKKKGEYALFFQGVDGTKYR